MEIGFDTCCVGMLLLKYPWITRIYIYIYKDIQYVYPSDKDISVSKGQDSGTQNTSIWVDDTLVQYWFGPRIPFSSQLGPLKEEDDCFLLGGHNDRPKSFE